MYCSNMDGPRDCHAEWSTSEKENIVWHPLYVKSKKKWYKGTYLPKKQTQRLREKDMVAGGVGKTGGEG